jgi:hypothetical protein
MFRLGMGCPVRMGNEDSIKFIVFKAYYHTKYQSWRKPGFFSFQFNKRLLEELQKTRSYYLLNLWGVQPVNFLKVRMKLV